ncbi:MAG: cysteine--tRNA ligase [Pirellulaceae bacterium]|jgi:cysteinyl-tRNA synthetase|nr:cysteine--tRNA ligase [Pirellulaceae bacterium]
MTLRVYNTLTRTKEPFVPVRPGQVGIYLCGPTVYDRAHIGHMVGPVIFDTIKRVLVHAGYRVTWVVNITDVDDKLIKKARERGLAMADVARENTADYLANLAGLGVDQIDHMPKATECMPEIIAFTQSLIERGYAYAVGGDVFFDVGRDPEYGKLTNRTVEALQGEGGEAAAKKRSAADFALWKQAKPGEPAWDSPWGLGRPGWHIECSAMSRSILGPTFDMHGGGLDLVFPHHENEIAQSECCHGQPMARYWLHNGLLKRAAAGKIGGRSERQATEAAGPLTLETIQQATAEKESRSAGAGGLAALIAQFGGEQIRFFLLRTHYRSTVLFSQEALAESSAALETFYRFFERFARITQDSFYRLPAARTRTEGAFEPGADPWLQAVARYRTSFLDNMDDDFNTGAAIGDLFELLRELNRFIDHHRLDDGTAPDAQRVAALRTGAAALRELAALLGLFRQPRAPQADTDDNALVGQLMELLIELRASARQKKDFATADRIRDALGRAGIVLEDRKGGTLWRAER